MKIFVCDANSDLSKIKLGQNDKLIFVTDSGKGEPMLPYSLFNMLRGTKVQVGVMPIERGQAGDIAFAMLYAAERAKGNEVIINSNALNMPPATMDKIYNSVFAGSAKKSSKKKTAETPQAQDAGTDKPAQGKSSDDELTIIEKIPEKAKSAAKKASAKIEEQANKVSEKVAKRKNKPVKDNQEDSTDDIDTFMDKLSSIDSSLVSHAKHIVDAARLAITENKPREEALKIISKTHGSKIYTILKKSGKEDEIFEMAGELKD